MCRVDLIKIDVVGCSRVESPIRIIPDGRRRVRVSNPRTKIARCRASVDSFGSTGDTALANLKRNISPSVGSPGTELEFAL